MVVIFCCRQAESFVLPLAKHISVEYHIYFERQISSIVDNGALNITITEFAANFDEQKFTTT